MDELVKDAVVKGKERKPRSDKGKRKNGKTAASALIDVLAALDGLTMNDMSKVLSAAAIFHNVANFEKRSEKDNG